MKTCKICLGQHPLTNFSRNSRAKDGLDARCKGCVRVIGAEYDARNRQKRAEAARSRREINPDKARCAERKWYAANAEYARAAQRARHAQNPETNRLAAAKWKTNRPGYSLLAVALWRQANPQKVRAQVAKRRCDKISRTPAWLTREDFVKMEFFYEMARALTESTGVLHHVDHELPLRGKYVSGLHVPGNLQILTATENMQKKNRWFPE